MVRYPPIDAFRGLSILGMIFFTVTLRISKNLPDVLKHNVWGTVNLGDFILPMFLFASGLSLAYFLKKREETEKKVVLKDVLLRFAKLSLIGVLLSFFSAYGFLEMDEVMLSALLFIACFILHRLNWKIIIGIIFFVNLSYFVIIKYDQLTIFVGHYLGGYPAALYYLPVMLSGLTIGKGITSKSLWCRSNQAFMWTTFFSFLFFVIFIPLNKMTASPSFIMLSILFSFGIFAAIDEIVTRNLNLNILQYIGRKPLRYWLNMYIVFIIPLWFYVEFFNQGAPLSIQWYLSVIISLMLMAVLYILSRVIDYITVSD